MMKKLCSFTLLLLLLVCIPNLAYSANIKKVLKGKWLQSTSEHFVITSDLDEQSLTSLTRELEEFRYFIAYVLGIDLIEEVHPVNILAISSQKVFKSLDLPEHWGGVFTKSLEGSYAIANLFGYSHRNPYHSLGKHVLFHEYVHFVMANRLSYNLYPAWYQEGIAEYFATYQRDNDIVTLGNSRILKERLWQLPAGKGRQMFGSIHAQQLFNAFSAHAYLDEKGNVQEHSQRAVEQFYARSTVATLYFYADKTRKAQLDQYLEAINNNASPYYALLAIFDTNYQALDDAITTFANHQPIIKTRYRIDPTNVEASLKGSTFKQLKKTEKQDTILPFLYTFNTIEKSELDEFLLKLLKKRKSSPELALLYLKNQPDSNLLSEDVSVRLEELQQSTANPAQVLTLLGKQKMESALLNKYTGNNEDWLTELYQARNYFRKAIAEDAYYGQPYFSLGKLYRYLRDNENLEEGLASLDSSTFLSNANAFSEIYLHEFFLHLRKQEFAEASSSLRRYIFLDNRYWPDDYGIFIYELLSYAEVFELPHQSEGLDVFYADGSTYKGESKNGVPHGKGLLERPSGAIYFGNWIKGKLQGHGEVWGQGGFYYQGNFDQGIAKGKAKIEYPEWSKEKYVEGEFLAGIKHGLVKTHYEFEQFSEGHFQYGVADGVHTISKTGVPNQTITFIDGKRRTTLDDGTVFIGDLTDTLEPIGKGYCKKDNAKPYICVFQ